MADHEQIERKFREVMRRRQMQEQEEDFDETLDDLETALLHLENLEDSAQRLGFSDMAMAAGDAMDELVHVADQHGVIEA